MNDGIYDPDSYLGVNTADIIAQDRCLTICCFTNACGLPASSIAFFLHFLAMRLNPVPGNQSGRWRTENLYLLLGRPT